MPTGRGRVQHPQSPALRTSTLPGFPGGHPLRHLFPRSLSSSSGTKRLLGDCLSPALALDAMPACKSHLPLPTPECEAQPHEPPCAPQPCFWARPSPLASPPYWPAPPWAGLSQQVWSREGQTQASGGKSLVSKVTQTPRERCPPAPTTCHTASPGSHLVYLHVSLRGGGDQAVSSVPKGAPGYAQGGLRRGAWLWPAGYRQ